MTTTHSQEVNILSINHASRFIASARIPLMTAGLFIAILSLLTLLWQTPWGISAGYRNWGDWILFFAGISDSMPEMPWRNGISLSNTGLFLGATASALLSRSYAFQVAPLSECIKALIGGVLMGTGAALAGGCNVGGFFSAVGLFSVGGYAMMAGLGAGAIIGLKILLWEINRNSNQSSGASTSVFKLNFGGNTLQISGIIILLAVTITFYYFSYIGKTPEGGLIFFGLLTGIIMHRSRFCFARAFRCPFMTGDSQMVKVVALSLAIYGTGAAVIKWSYIQPPSMGTHHPFWLGSLSGGILFGTGMVIAGGCASSVLWRLGEGNLKLLLTLISFSVTNALMYPVIKLPHISAILGKGSFLPDIVSWHLTLPVFMGLLLLWVIIAVWNEKTDTLTFV